MNAEFHYYAIHFLCLRAGFAENDARTIATSSQYVDNALRSWAVADGEGIFVTEVTQNYVFWDEGTLKNIYLPFHFVPGDPATANTQRRDGRASPYAVTPDSPLVKALLVEALKERNLFRIGIALHSYADSYAHQHFSGRLEEANAVEGSSLLPPAGHLQALRSPDDAMGLWEDPRLRPEYARVDNRVRFLSAARKIYRYMCTYLRRGFKDEDFIIDELGSLWSSDRAGSRDMKARLADFTIEFDIAPYDRREWLSEAGIVDETADEGPFVGYDKYLWLKAEVARRSGGGAPPRIQTGGRFANSSLKLWNEAARRHRSAAHNLMAAAGLSEASA